jgi:hypothetical protein
LGILQGNKFINALKSNVYQANLKKRFDIYVDGEFMRYKGMMADNMVLHHAAEAIVNASLEYLVQLLSDLERYIGKKVIISTCIWMASVSRER